MIRRRQNDGPAHPKPPAFRQANTWWQPKIPATAQGQPFSPATKPVDPRQKQATEAGMPTCLNIRRTLPLRKGAPAPGTRLPASRPKLRPCSRRRPTGAQTNPETKSSLERRLRHTRAPARVATRRLSWPSSPDERSDQPASAAISRAPRGSQAAASAEKRAEVSPRRDPTRSASGRSGR